MCKIGTLLRVLRCMLVLRARKRRTLACLLVTFCLFPSLLSLCTSLPGHNNH